MADARRPRTTGSSPIRSVPRPRRGTSARMAGALFTDIPLEGQVNLLTTGAFDSPGELLQTRTHARRRVLLGRRAGRRSRRLDGQGRAQSGRPELVDPGRQLRHCARRRAHRYQFGHVLRPASLRRRQRRRAGRDDRGGAQRRRRLRATTSGSSRAAPHDRLRRPLRALRLSARAGAAQPAAQRDASASTTARRMRGWRRGSCRAPGARGIPAADAAPHGCRRSAPSAPLTRDGFRPRTSSTTRSASSACSTARRSACARSTSASTISWSRVFGLRQPDGPAAELGHYFVGSAGDVDVEGGAVTSRTR